MENLEFSNLSNFELEVENRVSKANILKQVLLTLQEQKIKQIKKQINSNNSVSNDFALQGYCNNSKTLYEYYMRVYRNYRVLESKYKKCNGILSVFVLISEPYDSINPIYQKMLVYNAIKYVHDKALEVRDIL